MRGGYGVGLADGRLEERNEQMLNTFKKMPAALAVMAVATVAFGASVVGATPPDPTDGAASDLETGITSWVTSYGLPLLVALMVLGAVIAVLVKFARKARGQI